MGRFSTKINPVAILLLVCVPLLMLSGCASKAGSAKNVVPAAIIPTGPPEPYAMAMQEIKNQNLDKALRYLDLTIKDFPDNEEYVYKAYFVKNMIYMDYVNRCLHIMNVLLDGVKESPFANNSEKQRVVDFAQSTIDEINSYKTPYLESANYVLANYEKHNDLELSLVFSTEIDDAGPVNSVDWFSKYGTPVPSVEKMRAALVDVKILGFGQYCDIVIKSNKVDYPAYFSLTSRIAYEWDKDLSKQQLQEVLKITNDDKYNKYRLDAEDVLSKTFKQK